VGHVLVSGDRDVVLSIDEPASGAVCLASATVRGWAAAAGEPVVPDRVSIDDAPIPCVIAPAPRPDVAAHLGIEPRGNEGFECWVDLSRLPPGNIELRVHARGAVEPIPLLHAVARTRRLPDTGAVTAVGTAMLLSSSPIDPPHDGIAHHALAAERVLGQLGWDVVVHAGQAALELDAEAIRARMPGLAIVFGWPAAERLLPLVRHVSPDTVTIVDAVSTHFTTVARSALSRPGAALVPNAGTQYLAEISTYAAADAVLVVSELERSILGSLLPASRIQLFPIARESRTSPTPPWALRSGLLYVGNFDGWPNREAVEFLVEQVLPLLPPDFRARHRLRIVGHAAIEALASRYEGHPNVDVVGTVEDLDTEHDRARALVVSLLSGSGVKNKIVEALRAGLPVVTTTVGAEGMALRPGHEVERADDPRELADAIVRVVEDEGRWSRLAAAGRSWVAEHARPEEQARSLSSAVEAVLGASSPR